jgi:eukaryotic-like serine/threonine-protein kinase
MINTATVCSHCGATVPASESLAGFCLDCLLGAGLESSDLGLTYKYDHYEVLTDQDGDPIELGHGAMGVTYKAIDTILKSEVALKVIDPAYTDHELARQRFTREAQTAFKIRHPNIAGVLYAGTRADNQCFYAMELVPGETVEFRVRRAGPLPVGMALEATLQAARALRAIEQKGFVHRDLKPANLMLTASDRELMVKLIDFGLAKAVASEPGEATLTKDAFVGTPAFASPEHYNLEPIDSRSDFFSLGATLWYMLCGKPPFAGRNFEEIHQAQVKGILPTSELRAQRVPGPVTDLVSSLLQNDPAKRPQTADELIARLEACRSVTVSPKPISKSLLLSLFVALLGLGVTAASMRFFQSRGSSGVSENSLAVLPFDSLSDSPDDTYFADGVQDEILTDLAKVSGLKVISRNSVMSYRIPASRPATPQIAKVLGVRYLLEGSLKREGDRLRVNARLVDTVSDRQIWGEQYEGGREDLIQMQIRLAQQIVDQLRVELSASERNTIHESPTHDFAAYELYLRAKASYYSFDNYAAGAREKLELGILLLKEATERDPRFAEAWGLLAQLNGVIFSYGYDRSSARQSDAFEALDRAAQLQPESGSVHIIRGTLLSRVQGKYDEAKTEFQTALKTIPNSSLCYLMIGSIEWIKGHYREVEPNLVHAYELDPRYLVVITQLVSWYDANRNYAAKANLIDRVSAAGVSSEYFALQKAMISLEQSGNTGPYRSFLESIPKTSKAASRLTLSRYQLALADRNFAEAYQVLAEDGRDSYEGAATNLIYPRSYLEGLIARAANDIARAEEAFQAALPFARKQAADNPNSPGPLFVLAGTLAHLGHKEEAISIAKQMATLAPLEKNHQTGSSFQCYLAEVYSWSGEKEAAIRILQMLTTMPSLDINYGELKLNPEWDDLRGDPGFEQLAHDLAPKDLKASPSTGH